MNLVNIFGCDCKKMRKSIINKSNKEIEEQLSKCEKCNYIDYKKAGATTFFEKTYLQYRLKYVELFWYILKKEI